MSTSDRLLLFLHIGFAIFTLGPLTAATMSTPRYIRKRNVVVVRYLHRATRIYGRHVWASSCSGCCWPRATSPRCGCRCR